MFCHTMPMVLRAMRMARAMLDGLSSMSTTSAASMAASEPIAPMAMPMSARVSTGASLMPSPTKASLPFRRPARASPRAASPLRRPCPAAAAARGTRRCPARFATAAATSARSPVSMTVFFTPAARRAATASAASGLTTSAMTMWPMYSPSSDTCRMVPVSSQSWQSTPQRAHELVVAHVAPRARRPAPARRGRSAPPRRRCAAGRWAPSRPLAPTARWDGSSTPRRAPRCDSSRSGSMPAGGVHGHHVERARR